VGGLRICYNGLTSAVTLAYNNGVYATVAKIKPAAPPQLHGSHRVPQNTQNMGVAMPSGGSIVPWQRQKTQTNILLLSLSLSAEYISITLKRSHMHMFIIPVDDADYAFLTVSARACLSVNNIARKVVDDLEQFSASMDYGTVKKRLDCERSRPRG